MGSSWWPLPQITRTTSTVQCSRKEYARTLRVETIANSAGGTAQVAIVAQPSIGFLNAKYYSNGSPTGRYGRLPWPHHCRTHPIKILNRIGLPARHDGAHGHGSSCRDYCIWHPRPSKRRNDMGLAWLQRQPRTGKPCTDKQMVFELNTLMGIPSSSNRQPIPWPSDPISWSEHGIDLYWYEGPTLSGWKEIASKKSRQG